MKEILTGVNHGIGPTASHDGYVMLQYLFHGRLQHLLNIFDPWLTLPSTVIKTIVSDVKKIS
jgi:hypothetical protein